MGDNRPIGIFDSGIGGLTLVKAVHDELPDEHLLFFGDTIHLPYGDKSAKAIQAYADGILSFFHRQNCKAVIIACNTASAIAYSGLKKKWGAWLSLFNVVDPVIEFCISNTKAEKVGVIGTKGTIRSRAYPRKFQKAASNAKVTTASTPLLAPMIEEGFFNNTISKTIIGAYLSKKQFQQIDTLILGCTHYTLIKQEVENYYDGKVAVLDNINPTLNQVKKSLRQQDKFSDRTLNPSKASDHQFFVSDYTESFSETARFFFGDIVELKKRDIWGYTAS